MPLQEFLRKTLARLQLRRSLGRPKHRPAPPRELIHHAQRQRQLRPYHRKVRLHLHPQSHHRIQALQIDRQAFRVVRNAAVARRAIQLRNARGLPQLPHQRVLASTAS